MADNNSIVERIGVTVPRDSAGTSEGGHISDDLVLRLEQKIMELEGEMTNMRNLARFSISLNTPLETAMDNHTTMIQTSIPNHPPPTHPTSHQPNSTNMPPTNTQHPNVTYRSKSTSCPQNNFFAQDMPHVSATNMFYAGAPKNHNPNPIYVDTDPFTHQYHESESSQKDLLIQSLVEKLDKLSNRMQHVEENKGVVGLSYEDLCMHPDVELPEGYKPPKFKLFNGIGDPKAHLRIYCDKLVGVGKNEKIRMKLFIRSLTGEALSWYIKQDSQKWSNWVDMASDFMNSFGFNIENAPDWFYIQNLKKKPSETFRDYAIRWRSEAARARPPMEESQMKDYFIRAQEPQYYDRMMLITEKSFADIIKLGERIEEGIKNGTIINFEALQATNKALQYEGLSENRKKKEVGSVMMAHAIKTPRPYQYPMPPPQYPQSPYVAPTQYPTHFPYPSFPPYQIPPYQMAVHQIPPQYPSYPIYNVQPTYFQPPPPTKQQSYNFEKKPIKNYTLLVEPIAQLYERLKKAGYITPIPAKAPDTQSKWYDPNKICAYHSGMKGHTTETCRTLKDKIQDLIDTKAIQVKDPAPNNPFSNHK